MRDWGSLGRQTEERDDTEGRGEEGGTLLGSGVQLLVGMALECLQANEIGCWGTPRRGRAPRLFEFGSRVRGVAWRRPIRLLFWNGRWSALLVSWELSLRREALVGGTPLRSHLDCRNNVSGNWKNRTMHDECVHEMAAMKSVMRWQTLNSLSRPLPLRQPPPLPRVVLRAAGQLRMCVHGTT